LDWEVVKEPLRLNDCHSASPQEKNHVLVRTSPGSGPNRVILGRVAEDYTPLQNREALALLDPLVQAGTAEYHSAGAVDHGRRVWVLGRLLKPARIKGADTLDRYLLLVNNHTGASPQVQMRLMPHRLFCSNMLAAEIEMGRKVSITAAGDVYVQLQQAKESVRQVEQNYSAIESVFRRMADTPMTTDGAAEYVKEVLPEPVQTNPEEEHDPLRRLRELANTLFETGKGNDQPGIRGTLWAAYNGITELVDHHIPDESPEARLGRIWFGSGHEIKIRAYTVAIRWLRVATRAENWRSVGNRKELPRAIRRTAELPVVHPSGSMQKQAAELCAALP